MDLKNKLTDIIKNKIWYHINNSNTNSAGLLLENLLGIEKNEFPIPDYKDTEIKTKFDDTMFDMTLFHAAPDSYFFEIKRIYGTYGYTTLNNPNKVFLSSFCCTKITQIGKDIGAKLIIDWGNQKVILKFYNFKTNTIDDKASWSFKMLKERFDLKLKKLCLVYVKRKYENEIMYCKFYKCKFYKYKGFEHFLKALQYGHICIKFCINVFKDGPKIGQMHDHGTSFDISLTNLTDIFTKVDEIG